MPRDNCAVFGCGSNRRTKGLGIFKLPAPSNDNQRNGEEICSMRSRKARLLIRHLRKRSRRTQFIFVKNISSLQILKYVSNQVVIKLKGDRLQILIKA